MVGALGAAIHCRALGIPALVGGVTWERRPIDPVPGPRRLDEIVDPVRQLSDCAVLAGPGTRTDHGAHFAEARMAEHLGTPTVLVAVDRGPAAIADGVAEAAAALEADLLIFVDVGGDVLADGTEPGLASPLCDAVMLAAGALMEQRGLNVAGAVFGPCCDGELTVEEVLDHLARVAARGRPARHARDRSRNGGRARRPRQRPCRPRPARRRSAVRAGRSARR